MSMRQVHPGPCCAAVNSQTSSLEQVVSKHKKVEEPSINQTFYDKA